MIIAVNPRPLQASSSLSNVILPGNSRLEHDIPQPRFAMAKNLKRSASFVEDSNDSDGPLQITKKPKSAKASAAPAGKDDEGNDYWEVCFPLLISTECDIN